MTVPRRSVLSVLPALAALAGLEPATSAARAIVNVRDHGATGDGSTDDSAAIHTATQAVREGSILYFPAGKYRFAEQHPEGSAAVAITAVSNVDIAFDTGAELVMDNLDDEAGTGTSHGILIRGPASHIGLHNVKIRWANRAPRSMGDGIRILGYPTGMSASPVGWSGPPAPVSNVSITGCEIRSSPQAGMILMGVSNIRVTDLQVHGTAADGLHFNACRNARVSGYRVTDNGDDGLALVTYYADPPAFDTDSETFAFPALTDWSNSGFRISNISVAGGRANGVRLAGANGVVLSGLTVTGKKAGAGVVVDSAAELDSDWRYVASRGVRLNDISIDDCEMGIQLLGRPGSDGDNRFTDFDVDVGIARIHDCSNWAVRAESLTKRPVTGFRIGACTVDATSTSGGNGGIGLGNTRNVTFGKISLTHSQPVVAFSANDTRDLSVRSLQLSVTDRDRPQEDPIPCALFENCEGSISAMHVSWPQAPQSWTPVQVKRQTDNDDSTPKAQPVAIHKLSVKPASVVSHLRTV